MRTVAQLAAKLARTRREYADAARRVIRETDRYGAASVRTLANLDRCRAAVAYAAEDLAAAESAPQIVEPSADAARLSDNGATVAPASLGASL